ncbi:CBO0543 family protein [Bacillus sp. ISL-35]|uniref:CBO0543 family protein n=1 Tax=Bacillus sp. ISL-35 TaxID=2819122 RepID=UPI001BE920FA|nr:hypothetical protein [Chryseobacterium sp. ISL-80]
MLELLLVWTLAIIPTIYLDSAGYDLQFGLYPVKFIPIIPNATPFNIFMVGITFMLLYQYLSSWKTYIKGLIIMASTFAFIGEPLSHYLNLVYYIKWKYHYSFMYYIVLGITVKAIVNKCKNAYLR